MKKWILLSVTAVFVLITVFIVSCNRVNAPTNLAVKILSPTSGQVIALNNEVIVESVIPAGTKWSRLELLANACPSAWTLQKIIPLTRSWSSSPGFPPKKVQ
jgi:hypothetical protein